MAITLRYDAVAEYREAKYNVAATAVKPILVVDSKNAQVDATGGTLTANLYDGAGNAITTAGAMTSAISEGLLTFTFDTTKSDFALEKRYRVEWSITVSTVVYTGYFYFDVVKYPWLNLWADVFIQPELKKARGETNWNRIVQQAIAYLRLRIRTTRRVAQQTDTTHDDEYYESKGDIVITYPSRIRNPEDFGFAYMHLCHYLISDEAKDYEAADRYFKMFETEFTRVMGCLQYDEDDDMEVDAEERKPRSPFWKR